LTLEEERREGAGRVQVGGVFRRRLALRRLALGFPGVRAEQLGHARRCRPLPGRPHPGPLQRFVDLGQRVSEQVLHVGDAELEERGALDDALGPGRIFFARQLDDEAAAPLNLDDGLARAELVDPRAHHLLSALDGVGAVGDGALRLVHFERQVNTALQIEPEIDRHAPDRGVLHATRRRVAHPLGDVGRDQLPHRERQQPADGDES